MDGFIEKQINRVNRNFLLWNLILLALVGILTVANLRFFTNVLSGPTKVTKATLLSVSDPNSISNYYVTVTADDLKDTGVVHTTTTTRNGVKESEKTDGYYYAAFLDDKYLLVERETRDESTTLVGSLDTMVSDEKIKIIEDIEKDNPSLKGQFLPYKLNAKPFATTGSYFWMGVLAVLGLLGLFNIVRWVLRNSNKAAHPIMKQLAKFGDAQQAAQQINAQIPADSKGPLVTSPNWIATITALGAKLQRTDDLIWAHIIRTQHKTYGVTTSKTSALRIYDRNGKMQTVNFGTKAGKAEEFQDLLKANAPWVLVGYSDEIEKTWKKNRAEIIAAVDARRAAANRPAGAT